MTDTLDFNLISKAKAREINESLLGWPTENRVVIAVHTGEIKSSSGLIIPGKEKEDLPKKGVVVSKGITNDDPIHETLSIGDIVLYGKYGGKEIYPTFRKEIEGIEELKYYVLASNEVIFIEPNIKD